MTTTLPIIALLCWLALLGYGTNAPRGALLIIAGAPTIALMLTLAALVLVSSMGTRCIRFHFEDF